VSKENLLQVASREILHVTNKSSNLGIGEYDIDDVIFNIPIAEEIGRPCQETNAIGKLVSLGEKPNQTIFVYAGIDKPNTQPILNINEEPFSNPLNYLSPHARSVVQRYFDNCHWKGYGLGRYEQGPRHIIDIHYQMSTDETGLGYKSKTKYNPSKNMLELQPKNLIYDESLYLYHLPKSNDDKLISINMVQIEQINNKDIEPIFLVEKNIAKAEEYDSNDKTWIPIPNQLEEGSHIVIEETVDVNISDDPIKPKIIQLGKYLTEQEKESFISIIKEK